MTTCSHIVLMASYNEWMNAKLYETAGKLSPQELAADRKAFFGSLIGTLNHIVVADTIWLKRFATHPSNHPALDPIRKLRAPLSLDQLLFTDIGELFTHRKMLDEIIKQWAMALTEQDLSHALRYTNMKGVVAKKSFYSLVMHFFNHQTHHRGQATALLSQAGVNVGVTDLLALIPEEIET
ncbi:MAG: DinB family protein [Methylotenera sp.]